MKHTLNMPSLVLAISLVLFISCNHKEVLFDKASHLHTFFTEGEIKELQILVEEFDDYICQRFGTSSSNVAKCYRAFTTYYQGFEDNGDLSFVMDSSDQSHFLELLSKSLMKKLWTVSPTPHTFQGRLQISNRSAYWDYLKTFCKSDETLSHHKNRIEQVGDISPSVIAQFVINQSSLNFKDDEVRLFMAVYYLGLYI